MPEGIPILSKKHWNRVERDIKGSRSYPILKQKRVKNVPDTEVHREHARLAQRKFLGWSLRDGRKLKAVISTETQCKLCTQELMRCWCKLHVIAKCNPEMKRFLSYLFKHHLLHEEQVQYKWMCKYLIYYLSHSLSKEKGSLVDFYAGMSAKYKSGFGKFYSEPLLDLLEKVPPQNWVPYSAFPRWDFEEESKWWCSEFHISPNPQKQRSFRECIRKFIYKYAPIGLFVPPISAAVKVGNKRYNDGGEVRFDRERPAISYTSGFLRQIFITQPMQKREVWLPDKNVKTISTWWFNIVRQVLDKVPYYPGNRDLEDVHEQLMARVKQHMATWDITGFGIQYRRDFLEIIMEVLCEAFPSSSLDEMTRKSQDIFAKIVVETDPGFFRYPVRGIGLGYFENLKTLGVCAIVDDLDPVSVWGDEGMIETSLEKELHKRLEFFDFLDNKSKIEHFGSAPYWAGSIHIGGGQYVTPFESYSILCGGLDLGTHFERKQTLSTPQTHLWNGRRRFFNMYIAGTYEHIFGYEFTRGESLWHPDNGGLNIHTEYVDGWLKSWNVQDKKHPKDKVENLLAYSLPMSATPVDKKLARKFQIQRKKIYKRSKPFDTRVLRYESPRLNQLKTKTPDMSKLAHSTPLWSDMQMLIVDKITTGKFTSGLSGGSLYTAIRKCKLAPNPFESYASGGYEVVTPYYDKLKSIPQEHTEIVQYLNEVTDSIDSYLTMGDENFFYGRKIPKEKYADFRDSIMHTINPYLENRNEDPPPRIGEYPKVGFSFMNADLFIADPDEDPDDNLTYDNIGVEEELALLMGEELQFSDAETDQEHQPEWVL